jgi:tRNA pseudouridine38-40 synthase
VNVVLMVAYDGTRFHGFQRQAPEREPTVQGVLEAAASHICGQRVRLVAAGRTDSGVHASGQVISFPAVGALTPAIWLRALNATLPADVAVRGAGTAADNFSARYCAVSRTYVYTILNDPLPSPLDERYAYRYGHPLDAVAMDAGCRALVGTHDFRAFGHSPYDQRGSAAHHCVRTLYDASCRREGARLAIELRANAFLSGMARRIAGALLLLGAGRLTERQLHDILACGAKAHPGASLPARGLCLTAVEYPDQMIAWSPRAPE